VYEVSHISRRVKWFSTENLGAPNGGDPGPILPPGQERTPYGSYSGIGSVCKKSCTGPHGAQVVA
jgi:hypothetical protein